MNFTVIPQITVTAFVISLNFVLKGFIMIEVIQGALGSGKSAVATARGLAHIKEGGVVAANFALVDGWADVLAGRTLLARFSPEYRYEQAVSAYNRFFFVNSLEAIEKINPKQLAVHRQKTHGKYQEGQGLLILDECQLVFNSRKWEKNFSWIKFFTQSRKLGWNVLLIAHTIEMIDSQIRPLCEYESRFRNLQRITFPLTPIPLSPFPCFLVIRRYAGLGAGSSVIAGRGLYPLPLWAASLYDSLKVFSTEPTDADVVPVLCGSPPPYPQDLAVRVPDREHRSTCDCLWSKQDSFFQRDF